MLFLNGAEFRKVEWIIQQIQEFHCENQSAQSLANRVIFAHFFASYAIFVRHHFFWVSYLSILGGVFLNGIKVEFIVWTQVVPFPFQRDIPGTLLCLTVVGVSSISRVLVVLQKTNDVVVRCFLCLVLFMGGGIFDKRSAIFVRLCLWVP